MSRSPAIAAYASVPEITVARLLVAALAGGALGALVVLADVLVRITAG